MPDRLTSVSVALADPGVGLAPRTTPTAPQSHVPAEAQPALRDLFRRYLDARLDVYRSPSLAAARGKLARAAEIQKEIWSRALDACRSAVTKAAKRPKGCTALPTPNLRAMEARARTRLRLRSHQLPLNGTGSP